MDTIYERHGVTDQRRNADISTKGAGTAGIHIEKNLDHHNLQNSQVN